ncbi:MAG: type II toxin-antitoxin system RelE/ParE family toxin [Flavobacteriales bacterium]|nr:type II toxin-antitoxin system RelE/ParE family toxin [Flavobacteriales bacterium]
MVFREGARNDLRRIMVWHRDRKDGSEARVEAAMDAEVNRLRRHPRAYQMRRPPYRFALLDRFKYVIIYSVVDRTVVLHRIRHMHQRPLKRYSKD